MFDSVKNDFSIDFEAKSANGSSSAGSPETADTSFSHIWQLGRNYTQSLPTQTPDEGGLDLSADFVRRSAIDVSTNQLAASDLLGSKSFAKQTLASDISQSLVQESKAWQGGLLGTETSISATTPRQGLSQRQLNNAVGTFVVRRRGKVSTTFMFDGDSREGELALFNVAGMGGLTKNQFLKEATRRALSGGQKGHILIKDKTEGALFNGYLGEKSRNRGKATPEKRISLRPGTRFGLMLVPNGTVAEARAGKAPVRFSIADLNPGGRAQMGRVTRNIFGMESSPSSRSSSDFNDVVFRMRGARGGTPKLSKLLSPDQDWSKNTSQPFFKEYGINPTPELVNEPTPKPDPISEPTPKPDPISEPTPTLSPIDEPKPEPIPPSSGSPSLPGMTSSVSTSVSKFNPGSSETEIVASGAQKIVIGSQRIYIGTQQVTSINQNPIVRSFDDKNPKNNWTRTDIEATGTDGRGSGLLWTGKDLYGIFSVDGTQGDASQDFRRATTGATQNWLKSYGPGGGGRISVIAQLDPATGNLLKAAHLSSVLSTGKTNSLAVTDATVNEAGNIVLKANSFFAPRRPDGSMMTQNPGNTAGSPFDYTLEINKDLTQVLKTSAKGWS